jgi:hypothetical protein
MEMGFSGYILLLLTVVTGLAAGIGGIVLTLPQPRYQAARFGFIVSAVCFGGLGVVWGATSNQSLILRMAAAGITAAIAGVALAWILSQIWPSERKPDVSLEFAFAESPALVLLNNSDEIARQIKWTVELWNLDDPKVYSNPNAPDTINNHEPLPIPVTIFDFIRPHSKSGPLDLFNSAAVRSNVKLGDRLIGSASVICPDCERGHTFIVYIVFKKSGWYYEITDNKSGDVLIPKRLTKANVITYSEELMKTAPEKDRVPIVDPF